MKTGRLATPNMAKRERESATKRLNAVLHDTIFTFLYQIGIGEEALMHALYCRTGTINREKYNIDYGKPTQ